MRLKVLRDITCGNVELKEGTVLDSEDAQGPLPRKYLEKFAATWLAVGLCQNLEAEPAAPQA